MSESPATQVTEGAAAAVTTPAAEEFKPITTQEDLDKLIQARVARERDKYKGFDDYKKAADRLAQIEESNKTELEKAQARADAADAKIAAFEQKEQVSAWTQEVAKATGVPAEALRGSTKEEIEAHAEILKPGYTKAAASVSEGEGKGTPNVDGKKQDIFGSIIRS